MTNKNKVPNAKGKNRPEMLSDRLGYPTSVGDADWETKHKKLYTKQADDTWKRKS